MDSFHDLLDALGIQSGSLLYVHSSFSRLKRFGLNAGDIVNLLLERVGPDGTLVMPSFCWNILPEKRPWAGYADFLGYPPAFDVKHTPSNMGWLPETFRTRQGTLRSEHGIWPICAYGPLAEALTSGQHEVAHPYGPGSSFWMLVRENATLVGLGVTLNTSSLCPVADFALGAVHPQQVFTTAPVHVPVIRADDSLVDTATHTMTPQAVRHMNPSKLFSLSPTLSSTLTFLDLQGDFFFTYSSRSYHDVALVLGKKSSANGQPVPWLEALAIQGA